MCDPTAAVTLGAAALSAAGSVVEGSQASSEQQAVVDKQNQANQEWLAYQRKIKQDQDAAEADARTKATAAQQNTLAKISPAAQEGAQVTEQQRLNSLYGGKGAGEAQNPDNPSGMLLSGQTGNKDVGSITSEINQATGQARQRIAALATAGSYGGSFGGLGTTVPLALTQGGNDINLQNNIRQGNLKTFGVEQQVQPINYTIGPGTIAKGNLAKSLGSMAGTLAGAGGTRALSAFNAAAPAAGAAGNAMAPNDWGYIDDSMFATT